MEIYQWACCPWGGAVLPWKPKGGHPLREHYSDVRIRHRATQIDDGER